MPSMTRTAFNSHRPPRSNGPWSPCSESVGPPSGSAAGLGAGPGTGACLRAITLARLGDHAGAIAEAKAVADKSPVRGQNLYDSACVYSPASVAVLQDARLSQADRKELAAAYADQGVELLRRSHAAGFFNDASRLRNLKKDKHLDPLRSRTDFTKLLSELEQKSKKTKP